MDLPPVKSIETGEEEKADFAEFSLANNAAPEQRHGFAARQIRKKAESADCTAETVLPSLELKQEELAKENEKKILLEARIQAISDKYNVKIAGPGETAEYKSNIEVALRLPNSKELDVIESVLEKYSHISKKRQDGKIDFEGLRIGFAALSESARIKAMGWHDSASKPAGIYFAPKNDSVGRQGLESTALHEFAHQLQNLLWDDGQGNEDPPESFLKFFGFEEVPAAKSKMENGTYRLTDKHGQVWQHEDLGVDECDQDDYWYPVKNGEVQLDNGKAIVDEELRNRLPESKKPATSYFPDPSETHAEALAMLLFDRKMLFARNRQLYELMKVLDQKDIDRRFGVEKARERKEPFMIRNLEGKIVPNTMQEQSRLKNAERNWSLSDLTKLKEDPEEEEHDEKSNCACRKSSPSR